MRYIQNKNSKHLFVVATLGRMLESVNSKLSKIEELAIVEGNQNWKKSKLAIMLLTMKTFILQILDLYSKKPHEPSKRKIWYSKIKELMLQLKVVTKLANGEMQVQKEKLKEKEKLLLMEKQKILSPFKLMLLNQIQNIR